jgi:hypothetical protein
MRVCSRQGCDNPIPEDAARSRKYCSQQCSIKANNQKAMDRYNERKDRLRGKNICATVGCGTVLRRNNASKYCEGCLRTQRELREKDKIGRMIGEIIGA